MHYLKKQKSFYPLALAAVCLVIIVTYTWLYFVKVPYLGLLVTPATATIHTLYVIPEGNNSLQIGDRILQFGALDWAEQIEQGFAPAYPHTRAGEIIPVTVSRNGEKLEVDWQVPGFNWPEFAERLLTNWYLAYYFYFFGLFTLLLIYPHDLRTGLMSAWFCTLALWIIFGSVSEGLFYYSSELLHMTTWFLLALSFHFHWIFPRPVARIDNRVFWLFYLVSSLMALAELLHKLPLRAFFYAAGAAVLVSMGLLLINVWRHPDLRRQASLPLLVLPVILMIFIPSAILGYISGYVWLAQAGILALALLPPAYLYPLYSRQIGGMRFRANRLVSRAVFIILSFLGAVIVVALVDLLSVEPGSLLVASVIAITLATSTAAAWYPNFQSWFERRFLGMTIPSQNLLPWYSARLAESLDIERLADLLQEHVFPVLLVRQAALLRLYPAQATTGEPNLPGEQTSASQWMITPILQLQVDAEQLPRPDDLPGLINSAGRVIPPLRGTISQDVNQERLAWVRLALNLAVDGKTIGLCLLGKRDPDDAYDPPDIQLLEALMDQTALALVHIELAMELRDFLQADIQRQEAERNLIARELHDNLLGKMAVLAQSSDWMANDSHSLDAYQEAVQEIRLLVSGLRPAVLTYGLHLALEGLADDLRENLFNQGQPASVLLTLAGDHSRYPEDVELHLFRIAQQACYNAMQHARPNAIHISGELQPARIVLKVSDDGIGFLTSQTPDLAQLLARNQGSNQRHFGIIGMMERATLIHADLQIDSTPGSGTVVIVAWQEKQP